MDANGRDPARCGDDSTHAIANFEFERVVTYQRS
jgi:hypothetical protein